MLFVLCLLMFAEEESSPPVFSMTAFSASWIELILCCCCCCSWSSEFGLLSVVVASSSPVTNKTFLTRPPRVVISALRVLKRKDLSVLMRSGRRSERSSQQREAFMTNLAPLIVVISSEASSTVSSSTSVGIGLVSAINEVCRFSSFTCCITSASSEALSVCV